MGVFPLRELLNGQLRGTSERGVCSALTFGDDDETIARNTSIWAAMPHADVKGRGILDVNNGYSLQSGGGASFLLLLLTKADASARQVLWKCRPWLVLPVPENSSSEPTAR